MPITIEPGRYRKKPVVIEAIQWDGTIERAAEILAWVEGHGGSGNYHGTASGPTPHIAIETLEGAMAATEGWWVIRGVEGEFYPCKPSVFEATYEPADG
jgi:hypothetical protein